MAEDSGVMQFQECMIFGEKAGALWLLSTLEGKRRDREMVDPRGGS